MSKERHEEVRAILRQADESSRTLLSAGDDESNGSSVREAAERANAFLESTDPESVLAAVGLDTLPDGSEPSTIPEAIARGDDERVDDLNRLLTLASMAETDDDRLEEAAESIDAAIDGVEPDRSRAVDAESGRTGADETSAETEGGTDEPEVEPTADAEEPEGEPEGETADPIESAVRSTIAAVGDDLDRLRGRLEEATGADDESRPPEDAGGPDVDADETESDVDEEAAATAEGEAEADERAGGTDAAEAEESLDDREGDQADDDGGLLEPDLGTDRTVTSRGVVRHSTVAPSPSKRADMKGVARHSTLPYRD